MGCKRKILNKTERLLKEDNNSYLGDSVINVFPDGLKETAAKPEEKVDHLAF